MWHMQSGDRVLDEHEAELLLGMAAVLVDELAEEADGLRDCGCTELEAFGSLPWQARLQLLYDVLRALLYENVPAPELTAFNEAAVAAIFVKLDECLDTEIETDVEGYSKAIPLPHDDDFRLRRQILACIDRESVGDDWQPPAINSPDMTEWSVVLESLRDRILWDGDFTMYDPEKPLSPIVMASLDIDESYFTSIPPTPSDEAADALFDTVRKLTHRSLNH